jgi:hypothetical protein
MNRYIAARGLSYGLRKLHEVTNIHNTTLLIHKFMNNIKALVTVQLSKPHWTQER